MPQQPRSVLLLSFVWLFVIPCFASPTTTAHVGVQKPPPSAAVQASSSKRDEAEIHLLIAKYARSIDTADAKLASRVWWNSPQVSFINPVAHEHGFDAIKKHVYEQLMGATFSERLLTVHDIAIHVYQNSAWAEFDWDFHAKLRKNGSPIVTHGIETQVYWKIDSEWRLVHVHYSAVPAQSTP